MTYTRRNVWALGGDWADPILWYARGVKAMKARAMDQRLSWLFFAGMHDFDQKAWTALKLWTKTAPKPTGADYATFWRQCQHGSWYFEPWHRGYLLALEAAIRDAIAPLAGAPADWALPYWNYFKPGQNTLPPAFASPNWPDGNGDNPLYVVQRWGPQNDGNVYVDLTAVNESALSDAHFVGIGLQNGGSTGFGGPKTTFSNRGGVHGGIESQPHDQVHGMVGGAHGASDGLMSTPVTAGLDPIFWLHHANIDRLWEIWTHMPTAQGNPTDSAWLDGPAKQGGRAFIMPMPNNQTWTYTPKDVVSLAALGYDYDDVTPPAAAPALGARLQALGAGPEAAQQIERRVAMAGPPTVELMGANTGSLPVVGAAVQTTVALDPDVQRKTAATLALSTPETAPDRVFLNLENVRGRSDAAILNVYINLPDGADPLEHPELRAGSVGLFGVSGASVPDGDHAGDGVTYVLEITKIIDALHLQNALGAGRITVRLVPLAPVAKAARITIGRVSVYRQGE